MAKKADKKDTRSTTEVLSEMRTRGVEQKMPGTDRIVRIKSVDTPALLREGKMPDILTPLVVKSVYQELADRELRDFIGQQRGNSAEALAMLEAMEFVVKKAVADNTKVEELTLAEKRWIFRLAMGPAELLVTFRYQQEDDVEPVAEVEDVPPPTE
jgi:hypothetical protein